MMENKLQFIPDVSFFDYEWSYISKLLEKKGFPDWEYGGNLTFYDFDLFRNLIKINGDLKLRDEYAPSLGRLKIVMGNLDLRETEIIHLGDLEYVGGDLDLDWSNLRTLGKLKYVGGRLDLVCSYELASLGDLEYVGSYLDISSTKISSVDNLKYVGNSVIMRNTPISETKNLDKIFTKDRFPQGFMF